jgi:hypothetical protein
VFGVQYQGRSYIVHMCMSMCMNVCICMHFCMLLSYMYACVCRYACMNMRMILCMHIQVGRIEDVWFRVMYVCIHACICTYVCVHVYYVYAECLGFREQGSGLSLIYEYLCAHICMWSMRV